MESYRIYKSLPLEDFMDNITFVVAKAGLYLVPLIQNVNYLRKCEPHSEEYWKEHFMDCAIKTMERHTDKMERHMQITEFEKFFMFVPFSKKEDEDIKQVAQPIAVLENDRKD